jgi:hypothetical protein
VNIDRWLATPLVALVVLSWGPARAADTVETWDVGATDVDFYLGFDGIGPDEDARSMYGDIMLGYGLVHGLSAYIGATLSANDHFADGNADVYLGVFGTPVETDHFDLDLFLDVGAGGDGFDDFAVTPSTEINFDLDPDLGSWGLYLRMGVPVYGEPDEDDPGEHVRAFDVELNPGTYFTLGRGHQLLLEYDMSFHPRHEAHTTHVGGVALGYNVVLAEPIELINQIYVDIPQGDETAAVGLFTGIIVTMPSARRDRVAHLGAH